jgi:hypothetical protein
MKDPHKRMFVMFSILGLFSAGCTSDDPFSYVQVSGKITYEDGSPIPANVYLLFIPQSAPVDSKTHPRPGQAKVDRATGEFHTVTSHKLGDGLVRGRHKVTVVDPACHPLPATIVPPEYGDQKKTPLEVDTAALPFVLKVRKP